MFGNSQITVQCSSCEFLRHEVLSETIAGEADA
jgi:hypothetical protein